MGSNACNRDRKGEEEGKSKSQGDSETQNNNHRQREESKGQAGISITTLQSKLKQKSVMMHASRSYKSNWKETLFK